MKIDERRIKEAGLVLHAWTQAETLAVAAKRKHEKTDGKGGTDGNSREKTAFESG